MNWSWRIDMDHVVLRPTRLPVAVRDAGFIGRSLRAGNSPLGSAESWVRLDQVHGISVQHAETPGVLPGCDGVHLTTAGLRAVVRTADCLPVLLVAPGEGAVLLHAGWRGLAGGIVEQGVQRFQSPQAVSAWIGPAIGMCCFEVGSEVAVRFPEDTRSFPGGKPHVHLAANAARRLRSMGVAHIDDCGVCTRCHQHLVPSHRGSHGGPARLLAFVELHAEVPHAS